MKQSYLLGFAALVALAFAPLMATAAPPDFAFEAMLMQIDAPPGHTVAVGIADEVAFVALAIEVIKTVALAEGEYQIERMPSTVETPALSLIALPLVSQEVGGLFDPLGNPVGTTVKA